MSFLQEQQVIHRHPKRKAIPELSSVPSETKMIKLIDQLMIFFPLNELPLSHDHLHLSSNSKILTLAKKPHAN